MSYLLSTLIWSPIVYGGLVLFFGSALRSALQPLTLAFSFLILVLSGVLYSQFDFTTAQMQFVEQVLWIESFNIYYALGVDGIALPLILLTTLLTFVVVMASWNSVSNRMPEYLAAFMIMEGLMVGVFSAMDAMLFYVFWESMLVPMFLVIGIWGGPNRIYASIKFFLYTLLGSLLMLVALLYLYNMSDGTFSIQSYHQMPIPLSVQIALFVAFFAAFSVKIPMFPVHTWLPDAHVEAPTGGSIILAAVMLKMGGYGFLRFNLPIAPDASQYLSWVIICLSLIAVVYIAFVALVQQDMKKLIAYSSISHMGFVTLGIFVFNVQGINGAMVQMLSHGFISGALFLCVGILYHRTHSRLMSDYGGVVAVMPVFSVFAVLFAMANAGLPGTSGFVGEFFVILGAFAVSPVVGAIAALTLILGAAYTLWMVKRVFWGKAIKEAVLALKDVNQMELSALMILAFFVLLFGVWPQPLFEMLGSSVEALVEHIQVSKVM